MKNIREFLKEELKKPKIIEPKIKVPKEVINLFHQLYEIDNGGSLSRDGHKINKKINDLGYWVSNVRTEFRIHKNGFDSNDKPIKNL